VGKNTFGVADREQGSNPTALSSFASDLNGELYDRLAYRLRTSYCTRENLIPSQQ
jgi:hypothetical protein